MTRNHTPFEVSGYCELDKYASKAYSLIHNVPEELNIGDITKVNVSDLPKNIDLVSFAFPCTDISLAGKQDGFVDDKGNTTRSGLFFEALRIIKAIKPKFAICENVKGLTTKKFSKEFEIVLESMSEAGYNNYWSVLNAKDFNVPQNRERIFIIFIRKDIDNGYEFPEPTGLNLRLKDVLEDNVDEKFYLNEKAINYMSREVKGGRTHWDFGFHNDSSKEVSNCITANYRKGVPYNVLIDRYIVDNNEYFRIRKLTPKECFRLMGFDDSDIDILIENKISNTQLYKMAGNSICVPVLEAIFKNLYEQYEGVLMEREG